MDLDLDFGLVKKLFYSRNLIMKEVGKQIAASSFDPAYLLPILWLTYLPGELLRYIYPSWDLPAIRYLIFILMETILVGSEWRRFRTILRDCYLWYCGYGAGSKAVFQMVFWGSPIVTHLVANGLMLWLGLWMYGWSGVSFLKLLLKLVVLLVLSQAIVFGAVPMLFLFGFMLVATDPGQVAMGFSPFTAIIVQLVELASVDTNFFCRNSIIAQYNRFNRRVFLREATEKDGHRRPQFMPTYLYQSLDEAKREIRLVRTTRRNPEAEPQFELVTVSLDKNPTYHAISYVWGDPSIDKSGVVIENQWLDTTRSTFEILHHHLGWWSKYNSGRPEDVYYWIDFLCINQKNITERNSQVLLMGDIYSKAKTVISYLKPDDLDETDVATHFLASLETDLLNRRRRSYGLFPRFLTAPSISNVIAGWFSDATGLAPSAGWEAISKLYSHPYWTRMWIVQEIALSKKLRIYYGDRALEWDQLHLFASQTPEFAEKYIETSYGMFVHGETFNQSRFRVRQTMQLMERKRINKQPSLVELLTEVPSMECSNNRDRIWALFGLIDSKTLPTNMQPDYENMTASQLYENTARYLLQSVDWEWTLCMAGIGHSPEPDTTIPSWAPNWRVRHPIPLPAMRLRLAGDKPPLPASITFPDDLKSLPIEGSLITLIKSITPITHLFEDVNMETAKTHLASQLWNIKNLFRDLSAADILMTPERILALGDTFSAGQKPDSIAGWKILYGFWDSLRSEVENMPASDEPPKVLSPGLMWRVMGSVRAVASSGAIVDAWSTVTNVCKLRGFAIMEDKRFALVPSFARKGDAVFSVRGASSLFVMRLEVGEGGVLRWKLVGDCYLSEVVDGEEGGGWNGEYREVVLL